MSEPMASRIGGALDALEAEGVRIILAVESGSRAWGFPSPDSDWDVRFIYARPVDFYLQVRERRDVIERCDGLLDLSGWDVRKAIGLLLKHNASAVEWLRSPIVYRSHSSVELLRDFATEVSLDGLRRHYYHLARSIWRERFERRAVVPIKKYFYLLRPSLALRFMRITGESPPMDLPSLLAGADVDASHAEMIADLVRRKAVTREMADEGRLEPLDALCVEEIGLAEALLGKDPPTSEERYSQADALFRNLIGYSQ